MIKHLVMWKLADTAENNGATPNFVVAILLGGWGKPVLV